MANFKIKLTLILYLIFALIFSVYAHFNAESLLIFLFMVFINIMVLIIKLLIFYVEKIIFLVIHNHFILVRIFFAI